ncbi:MAG: aminopeptidase, partial [Chthoniobacteraceae bacterium]
MHDPRFDLLAKNLVAFSVSLKRGERVLCDMFDVPDEMTVALVRAVRAVRAVPFVQIHHGRVSREMSLGAVSEGLEITAGIQLAQMKKMHAYIAFRGG